MSRHPCSSSRVRAPSPGIAEPDPSIDLLAYVYVDRSWVDLRCMLRRVVDIGALLEGAVALGSSVPSHSPPVDTAQSISKGLEMLIQCSLAQPASVVVPQPIPTAIPGIGYSLVRFREALAQVAIPICIRGRSYEVGSMAYAD
eukprot:jgi/Botrbrau1/19076/Bobra.0772s0004.1